MPSPSGSVGPADIVSRILVLRGQRVLLDVDVAALYGVPTERLNQQVRRNRAKFPLDFVFQLEISELRDNRLQFASGSQKHRDPRYLPLAFTEHGAFMAAALLNSPRALPAAISSLADTSSRFGNFLLGSNRAIQGDR